MSRISTSVVTLSKVTLCLYRKSETEGATIISVVTKKLSETSEYQQHRVTRYRTYPGSIQEAEDKMLPPFPTLLLKQLYQSISLLSDVRFGINRCAYDTARSLMCAIPVVRVTNREII